MIGEWTLAQLAPELDAVLVSADAAFHGVSTDTRTLQPGDLFVALKGPNFDGHRFIAQALAQGAVAAVVSEAQALEIPQLLVADTRIALGQIARINRRRFNAPVFAVTGSVGKTTVKEMLAAILLQKGKVLATRGNLNNDIGAPLTLLSLQGDEAHAVIELGASAEQEIAYTTALTLPDVAILNNAMGAHLEGFGSLAGVVRAKGEIFQGLSDQGWAIVNRDDPHAAEWLRLDTVRNVLTFGVDNPQADVQATALAAGDNGCFRFALGYRGESESVQLKVMGRHNVANATAAAAAIIAAGYPLKLAARGLETFEAVPGRTRPYAGVNGMTVVDDSYNANPGSVKAAIDLLSTLPGKRLLVLGDMAELGETAPEQHADVGSYAAQKGTDRLLAVGALSLYAVEAFNASTGIQGGHYQTRENLVEAILALAEPGVTVLVKGSRSAGMEKVVAELVKGTE